MSIYTGGYTSRMANIVEHLIDGRPSMVERLESADRWSALFGLNGACWRWSRWWSAWLRIGLLGLELGMDMNIVLVKGFGKRAPVRARKG